MDIINELIKGPSHILQIDHASSSGDRTMLTINHGANIDSFDLDSLNTGYLSLSNDNMRVSSISGSLNVEGSSVGTAMGTGMFTTIESNFLGRTEFNDEISNLLRTIELRFDNVDQRILEILSGRENREE